MLACVAQVYCTLYCTYIYEEYCTVVVDFSRAARTRIFKQIDTQNAEMLVRRENLQNTSLGKKSMKVLQLHFFKNASEGATVKSECFCRKAEANPFKLFLSKLSLSNFLLLSTGHFFIITVQTNKTAQ